MDIFETGADRLKFLSLLAGACAVQHARVHAYTLMDNHFHLLIEDPRGTLSSLMLSLQSAYARYFNDSRGSRGEGAVFARRFWSERVSSPGYYDAVTSYILLNPLRCSSPLARRAEEYPWSSAALHASGLDAPTFYARLMEREGGLESVLAALPRPTRVEYDDRRRSQFAALLSGDWISPAAARCGRSPEQMRQVLADRVGMRPPEPQDESTETASSTAFPGANRPTRTDLPTRAQRRRGVTTIARLWEQLPRVTDPFTGHAIDEAADLIRRACSALMPGDEAATIEVTCYMLWRFTSGSAHQIAATLRKDREAVVRAIERVGGLRLQTDSWPRLLWRIEWRLYFPLRSSPWRA